MHACALQILQHIHVIFEINKLYFLVLNHYLFVPYKCLPRKDNKEKTVIMYCVGLQQVISELPFTSVSKQVLLQSLLYGNQFHYLGHEAPSLKMGSVCFSYYYLFCNNVLFVFCFLFFGGGFDFWSYADWLARHQ